MDEWMIFDRRVFDRRINLIAGDSAREQRLLKTRLIADPGREARDDTLQIVREEIAAVVVPANADQGILRLPRTSHFNQGTLPINRNLPVN